MANRHHLWALLARLRVRPLVFSPVVAAEDPAEVRENAGAVATIITAPLREVMLRLLLPIPGRVLRVTYTKGDKFWVHWHIHNF